MAPISSAGSASAPLEDAAAATIVAIPAAGRHSYGQILKSSALIGGSSVINVAVSIARVKIMALLLGPAGVGLVGLYGSILDLTQSIAGMGVNSSGVRQIAEAAGSGETRRVARTAAVLPLDIAPAWHDGCCPPHRFLPSSVTVDVQQ